MTFLTFDSDDDEDGDDDEEREEVCLDHIVMIFVILLM